MKAATLIVPVFLLAIAATAHAGKGGAGPAASASTGVGSVVNPGSDAVLNAVGRDENGDPLVPGQSGGVILIGAQLTQAASVLNGAEGAVIDGALIRVPTVLGDGGAALIVLNTETGELLIKRQ